MERPGLGSQRWLEEVICSKMMWTKSWLNVAIHSEVGFIQVGSYGFAEMTEVFSRTKMIFE